MPEGTAGAGSKATGYTEIRNGICEKCHVAMDIIDDVYHCPTCGGGTGELLVAFNSEDAEDYWGNEYQKERINYCMANRNKDIPVYLRTGGKLPRFKNKKGEAQRLRELNLLRG